MAFVKVEWGRKKKNPRENVKFPLVCFCFHSSDGFPPTRLADRIRRVASFVISTVTDSTASLSLFFFFFLICPHSHKTNPQSTRAFLQKLPVLSYPLAEMEAGAFPDFL